MSETAAPQYPSILAEDYHSELLESHSQTRFDWARISDRELELLAEWWKISVEELRQKCEMMALTINSSRAREGFDLLVHRLHTRGGIGDELYWKFHDLRITKLAKSGNYEVVQARDRIYYGTIIAAHLDPPGPGFNQHYKLQEWSGCVQIEWDDPLPQKTEGHQTTQGNQYISSQGGQLFGHFTGGSLAFRARIPTDDPEVLIQRFPELIGRRVSTDEREGDSTWRIVPRFPSRSIKDGKRE